MSSDLVKRLRERAGLAASEGNMTAKCDANHFTEAADTIEALEGELQKWKALGEGAALECQDQKSRSNAADARAERLRVALERAKRYVENSVHLTADMKLIEEALEDKQ
jgi:hypothetical protein